MSTLPIDAIDVTERYRADYGDIDALAASMEDVGLLQPIAVTPEYKLIAGERRLRAAQQLGWAEIPIIVIDGLDDAQEYFSAQRDENTCRKDFTPSEAVALGKKLEALEKPKAKERQKELGKTHGTPSSDSDEGERGRTDDKVANTIGMGRNRYRKARSVVEAAEEAPDEYGDLVEQMDKSGSVHGAYKKLEKAEAREEVAEEAAEKTNKPIVTLADYSDWLPVEESCDLLLTDPPYSTDVSDVAEFAEAWLPAALSKVKATGRAYVFIGAYPEELQAYLNASDSIDSAVTLKQILPWTYRNTLGKAPKKRYKQNWQAILYFVGNEAGELNCPLTEEQFAVHDINAPDGRTGLRYHEWQKPDELAERIVRHATQQGDLVLDCFAGTGTFLLAAAELGRIARGCDIDPDILQIAQERGCSNG